MPRGEGSASYSAGPKIAHFDHVEWLAISDSATAVAALAQGEVDWLDSVTTDQMPLLARDANVTVEVREPTGSIPVMRFNHLHPPFNNSAIRRALLGAIDQADVMRALAGTDRAYWNDHIGLFGPSSPLANEAGIEVLSGPRDYNKVQHALSEAGYRGEPVTVLATADNIYFATLSDVGVDQLRKAGLNVDVQTMDFSTMVRRRNSKEVRDKGGWNIYFTFIDGLFASHPAASGLFRADGKSGLPGWPDSPRLEALRQAWLEASDLDDQKKICTQMQLQLWQDVPYIPLGHWVRATAHRRNIVDLPWGFAAFYGVRRV